MRIGAAIALLATLVLPTAGCSREFFRQYEYEEEIYLSLDGSATVYVNSSIPALNALRGSSFDTGAGAQISRQAVRDWFTTPTTRLSRNPTFSRRSGRRFVHVRLDVDKIEDLAAAAPFAWSSYHFAKQNDLFLYRQVIGPAAGGDAGDTGWKGQELVAFRLHLPSKIVYHNAGAGNLRRGNILVWEQPLVDRLKGEPLALDARIESQSILSNTLLLFGTTIVAVAITFAGILWWVVRGPHPTRLS